MRTNPRYVDLALHLADHPVLALYEGVLLERQHRDELGQGRERAQRGEAVGGDVDDLQHRALAQLLGQARQLIRRRLEISQLGQLAELAGQAR